MSGMRNFPKVQLKLRDDNGGTLRIIKKIFIERKSKTIPGGFNISVKVGTHYNLFTICTEDGKSFRERFFPLFLYTYTDYVLSYI